MADYDEIRSGRRRDWWKQKEAERKRTAKKLPPMEEMEHLIEEANAPPLPRKRPKRKSEWDEEPPEDFGLPGPPPDPSLLEPERRGEEPAAKRRPPARTRFEREREKDRAEWEKTKRQLFVLGAVAGGVLLTLFVLGIAWRAISTSREQAEMARFTKMADKGVYIDDISDPIRALATYRSAWIRGDMTLVWKITSPASKKDILAVRTEEQHIRDQIRLYNNGGDKDWIAVVKGYTEPKYLHEPSKPYSNGELAVFLTQAYRPSRGSHIEQRYAIAFVYANGKWQYLESVPESSWKNTWTSVYDAKPGASIESSSY